MFCLSFAMLSLLDMSYLSRSRVFWKEPLYLYEVGVRLYVHHILLGPHLWNFTEYVVALMLPYLCHLYRKSCAFIEPHVARTLQKYQRVRVGFSKSSIFPEN